MRYLKHFEAKYDPKADLIKYADDIVRVFTLYYQTHDDYLCRQIDELIWNSSVNIDQFENDGILTEDLMREVFEDYRNSGMRDIENILNIYYDCIPFIKVLSEETKKKIEEVFYDLTDNGDYRISKDSSNNDDRYIVDIKLKDAFFKISFEEIINRLEDLGFEGFSFKGTRNTNQIDNINIIFWRKLPKELRDEYD